MLEQHLGHLVLAGGRTVLECHPPREGRFVSFGELDALVWIESQVQEQFQDFWLILSRCDTQQSTEVINRISQGPFCMPRSKPVCVAPSNGGRRWFTKRILRWGEAVLAGHWIATFLFFFFDDADDLGVSALDGDRVRRGGGPVRIDTIARIGAVGHEDAHHLRRTRQNGVMDDLEVIHRHPRQLGT